MNCVELQASLAEQEDARSKDQRAHLETCPECSSLVAELSLIAATAIELRGAHDPSPRVWNSIEIALRQEGLIRPRPSRSLLPVFGSQWAWARWMLPVAALVLVLVGIYLRQNTPILDLANNEPTVAPVSDLAIAGLNDDDLLQEVAQLSPDIRAQYADNLRYVNEYIRDAKNVIAENPNDEEARRSLLDAYQQKAMLFDLAMEHSLP